MKKLVLGILSSIILTTNVLANEIETKKVISTGVGLTESEALKDTTRNAVQQVVGSYILSDTYVKNSQLIKDEILINSNGFVKGFKIISQTKEASGLVKIEAEVEVEPGNVTKRLGELNIALKDVATTEFKAISLDKFQATKDFKKMFDEIVLKPIKENKQIYDIKIGELKSVDKLKGLTNSDSSLMPFVLSFTVNFKKDYIESVKNFLDKSSINKFDGYIPENFHNYDNSVIFSKFDIKRDSPLKQKVFYELNQNLKTTYNSLVSNLHDNYAPTIIIRINDLNNQAIKIMNFRQYKNMSSDYHSNLRITNIDQQSSDVGYLFGYRTSNYIDFIDDIKNMELEMYLNEEEVSKIKNASIEIKVEKEK